MGKPARAPSAESSENADLEALVQQIRSTNAPSTEDVYVKCLAIADLKKVLEHVDVLAAAGYLEDVLWRHAEVATASCKSSELGQQKAWVVSVMMLVNYKLRESAVDVWSIVEVKDPNTKKSGSSHFEAFVATLLSLKHGEHAASVNWSVLEKSYLIQFLINCYQSLEIPAIAKTFLKLTSLPTWSALSPTQRSIEFEKYPKLERHWKNTIGGAASDADVDQDKPSKRRKVAPVSQVAVSIHEKSFIADLIREFFRTINEPSKATDQAEIDDKLLYTAIFLAFVIDLLSQLPTRRFLQVVLQRFHFVMVVRRSPFIADCLQWRSAFEIAGLKKQIALVEALIHFPIDSHTGRSFTTREQRENDSTRIQTLQQCAFQEYRNTPLEELAIIPVSSIADRKTFSSHLKPIVGSDRARVNALAVTLGVVADLEEASTLSSDELVECFLNEYAPSRGDVSEWSETAIFPTEVDIWNDLLESDDQSGGSFVYGVQGKLIPLLPIRKLSLQFLNIGDYLQRNYELFRLEASYDIRSSLESSIKQLDAVRSLTSAETVFRGHSQMAVPLSSPLKIMKISKPALGKTNPASVVGQFDVELDSRHDFNVFDNYQTKEVVFLITLRATNDEAAEVMGFSNQKNELGKEKTYFPEEYGVLYVRGAEVIEVVDGYGAAVNDENPRGKGKKRTFKVALDGLQYKTDLEEGRLDAYQHVNVLVRRKARENNFKAVLDTVLDTWSNAKKDELLPSWFHDLLLGYGHPSAATYKSICKQRQQQEVVVPLLALVSDGEHALETCAEDGTSGLCLVDSDDVDKPLAAKDAIGPFTYVENLKDGSVLVKAHRRSPEETSISAPPRIRFTKSQVAAVRSGMCEGLTVIVGPPGTGKTDVAVQLVLNLHRTTPSSEKILIVAHSNQALNDFFSKILSRKLINEAEIVRLGQGQHTDAAIFQDDFSRNGRVNYLLQRRLDLLKEVEFLAKWLEEKNPNQYSGLGSSAGYSCENAVFFYQCHLKTLLHAAKDVSKPTEYTLLSEYFTTRNGVAPESREAGLQLVNTMEAYFGELQRLQPFELLQTPRQRGDLYLIQHARIIAMTCTHAALNQRKLVDLGLTFGSFIMEEAGQVSEIDTLIPLLLASSSPTKSLKKKSDETQLKRIVLMGDPNQLPPVVKSMALKDYAHLDQSLFTRLLRLDVPRIVLDQQGRSRSLLADLYRWRYSSDDHQLRDLPHVAKSTKYEAPNPGFAYVAQFIQVPLSKERQTKPFAYENEEEARFIVSLFKYMLAIGYDAAKITILTTYNAQKELLQRLLRREDSLPKCKVSTVDRFQGQQNDFILLSTVRSGSSIGHLRDVRRACTAFSRARLGFYVLGNEATLRKSKELEPFTSRLFGMAAEHPSQLALLPSERVGKAVNREKKPTGKKSADTVIRLAKECRPQLEKIIADVLKTN
ncbi:Intron-binding protein aquarius, partial [Globisporangium splendens]